jgi:DNA polymerase-3 subunit delta
VKGADVKLSYPDYLKSKDVTCLGRWCLFSGPEHHLKHEALERVRDEARRVGGEDPSWDVLDGKGLSPADVLRRSQTGALFGGARVIVVRPVERMEAEDQRALAKSVGPLPEGSTVILVTSETGDRRRRRAVGTALRNAVDKHGLVVQFAALKVGEAVAWATAQAKRRGTKLEPAAARKLVQQKVGTGLGELEAEIEKLALFVGDLDIIAASHVDEVTPRTIEDSVFQLVDAVGRREAGRAVGMLREMLAEKRESPGRIVAMLAQNVRLIWQTKLLTERGWRPGRDVDEETAALLPQDERKSALAQFERLNWLAARTVRQAKAFSWGRLARAMAALTACDWALKGIRPQVGDDGATLELLVVQLCSDIEMPVWAAWA